MLTSINIQKNSICIIYNWNDNKFDRLPFPEPRVQLASTYHEEPMAELADEIEHVKALILEKLDDLNALRTKLREEYVPLTVCNHLEQCIKETEVPSLFFSSNLIIYSH